MDILAELEKRVGIIIPGEDAQPRMVGFKDILDVVATGIYFVDRDRKIVYWNKGAEIISGYKAGEVLGRPCSDNILTHVNHQGESLCQGACPLASTMTDGEPRKAQVFLYYKGGYRLPVMVTTDAIRDGRGNIIGGIELFHDLSSPMAAIERLEDLGDTAHLDTVSGMVTPDYLKAFVADRLNDLKDFSLPCSIALIDIDDLAKLQERYGQAVGDQIVAMVAKTLAKNSRSFDLVGRWGNSEFGCILANQDRQTLADSAEKYHRLIAQSRLPHETGDIKVTVSVGATLARPDDTLESLAQRAGELLAQSKSAGGSRVTVA